VRRSTLPNSISSNTKLNILLPFLLRYYHPWSQRHTPTVCKPLDVRMIKTQTVLSVKARTAWYGAEC
jgi:hypothetical protein